MGIAAISIEPPKKRMVNLCACIILLKEEQLVVSKWLVIFSSNFEFLDMSFVDN